MTLGARLAPWAELHEDLMLQILSSLAPVWKDRYGYRSVRRTFFADLMSVHACCKAWARIAARTEAWSVRWQKVRESYVWPLRHCVLQLSMKMSVYGQDRDDPCKIIHDSRNFKSVKMWNVTFELPFMSFGSAQSTFRHDNNPFQQIMLPFDRDFDGEPYVEDLTPDLAQGDEYVSPQRYGFDASPRKRLMHVRRQMTHARIYDTVTKREFVLIPRWADPVDVCGLVPSWVNFRAEMPLRDPTVERGFMARGDSSYMDRSLDVLEYLRDRQREEFLEKYSEEDLCFFESSAREMMLPQLGSYHLDLQIDFELNPNDDDLDQLGLSFCTNGNPSGWAYPDLGDLDRDLGVDFAVPAILLLLGEPAPVLPPHGDELYRRHEADAAALRTWLKTGSCRKRRAR